MRAFDDGIVEVRFGIEARQAVRAATTPALGGFLYRSQGSTVDVSLEPGGPIVARIAAAGLSIRGQQKQRGWIHGAVFTSAGVAVGWMPRRQLEPVDAAALREEQQQAATLVSLLDATEGPADGVLSTPPWIGDSIEVVCPTPIELAVEERGVSIRIGTLRPEHAFFVSIGAATRLTTEGPTVRHVRHIEGSSLVDHGADVPGLLPTVLVRDADLTGCTLHET